MGCRSREVSQALGCLFDIGTSAGLTDGQLLERFVHRRDEAGERAFGALVERHGPMVLRVCRGILGDEHEAMDAFQATFLVLARKARSLWVEDSLGPWLHRVACRAAGRARAESTRRNALHRRLLQTTVRCSGKRVGGDLTADLHEVIDCLGEHDRLPLVLCELEGYTYEEAARQLGWSVGTVKSRLARARERLRQRLTRRGLVMPPGLLGAARLSELTTSATTRGLLESTTGAAVRFARGRAAAGAASSGATTLSEGVLRIMLMTKLKTLAAAGLLMGLVAGSVTLVARSSDAQAPRPAFAQAEQARGEGDDTRKQVDDLRKAQTELADEVRSLKDDIKTLKAAPGRLTGPGGGMGMGAQGRLFGPGGGMGQYGGVTKPFNGAIGGGAGTSQRPAITTIESAQIIAVLSPARDKIWAQSARWGVWKAYQVPTGVKATPIMSGSVLTVMAEGPKIDQLAAFEPDAGDWVTQDLREPAEGRVMPIVGEALAAYKIGRFIYAFSALCKRWDVLELPPGSTPLPTIGATYIKVEDGTRLHVFGTRTGRWSSLDTKGDDR